MQIMLFLLIKLLLIIIDNINLFQLLQKFNLNHIHFNRIKLNNLLLFS